MPLNRNELRDLLQATLLTSENEIGCDSCLERVAAYAESHLTGLPTPEALKLGVALIRDGVAAGASGRF